MVHGNNIADEDWVGDDDKSDDGEEHMPANSGPLGPPLPNRSQVRKVLSPAPAFHINPDNSKLDEVNEGASRLVSSDGIQRTVQKKVIVIRQVEECPAAHP